MRAIHVNRVLRELRTSGVMTLRNSRMVLADVAKLTAIAGFDDSYLHRRTTASNDYSAHRDTDRG